MNIPEKFNKILSEDQSINSIVLDVISSFENILIDNKLFFFEEYTDHGIKHIESVLESAEFIISNESFENITPKEISILILSIILHDLGMHIELLTFKSMLNGEYDEYKNPTLDTKTWSELWSDYLSEVKRFSSIQKKNVFGNELASITIPDLSNKDQLNGKDKKLIGEFLRRNHGRIAQEICLSGLKSENGFIEFGTTKLDKKTKQLVGLVARSHSMNIRDTFEYLREIGYDSWRNPHGINIVYLMVILRIADYIQIDNSRTYPHILKLKSFSSPISQLEHLTHLSIDSLNFNVPDIEQIYVYCSPSDSEMFVKIETLISDIQNELDKSWAVLGEVYGFIPSQKPSIKFRRISSNLSNKTYLKGLKYVPEKVNFKVDSNLSKLLIAPLYGDNPTFGVRELLQNSIDACIERKEIENSESFIPKIEVSIQRINDDQSIFQIKDNGKGMTPDEIINYFLNVGSSFRKSMDWKKKFIDESGKTKVNRNGKFGIGVLASFLLGEEISVTTKSLLENEINFFSASIDSEFINIIKQESDFEIGTTICITVSNDIRNKLLDHEPDWDDHSLSWTDWYLFDDPKVVFSVDGQIIKFTNIISGVTFFDFCTNDFEKISWSYDVKDSTSRETSLIACNGIVITESYYNKFVYPENNSAHSYDSKYILNKKPSILIVDKEGIFPVKLDRNGLDCEEFPFEEELITEVAKHFIINLLNMEIDDKIFKEQILLHNTKIIYGTDGFIINSEYFINGIQNKYNYIRLIIEDNQIEIDLKTFKNCLLDLKFDSKINLSYQEFNVAPEGGGIILLKKNKYESLFESPVKRLNRYVTESATVIERSNEYVLYKIYDYNNEAVVLKNLNCLDQDLLDKVESIQEISSQLFKLKDGDILSSLFKKYIKEDFIIPYDIAKRKIIYKEAFAELSHYLKK